MDGVISQSDKNYLDTLIKYNKTLSQRNALLKYFSANHTFNPETLAIYNEQMTALGTILHTKRKDFLEAFTPIFKKRYAAISGDKEEVKLKYKSVVL